MDFEEKIVYVISGSCGVGKSTISRKIAEKYSLSVHLNVDYIYEMYVGGYVSPWKDDGSRLKLLLKNIKDMIKNYIDSNYTVVIDYVLFPEDLNDIVYKDIKLKYVVLTASEETVIRRDLSRPADEIMGNRAVELLNEFKEKDIDKRFILDTTNLSVDDAVDIILKDSRFLLQKRK